MGEQFDCIVVGGGPAGSVLAARLSEDAGKQVLLIEAGPDYGPDPLNWPTELLDHVGIWPDTHSWGYFNKESSTGRRLQLPRARVLGGSSTVNGCIWLRGSQSDYDGWAAAGNPGWSFDGLLPFFQRVECDTIGGDIHGRSGPVPIYRVPDSELSALDVALMTTANECGIDILDDLNATATQQVGVGKTPKNILDGHRHNAALSYLAMARDRPNLTIVADTLVDRVLLHERRAYGVISSDGEVFAGREIVLSAGAYGSPAILLRSGIGPGAHLCDLDISCQVQLPGVGANLMDHPQIARQSGLTSFPIRPEYTPERKVFIQTLVKASSSQSPGDVDLHLYPAEMFDERFGCWTLAFGVTLQYARSRGTVRLTSPDPEAPLDIDHNYFSDPADMEAICDGYELMQRIVSTPPLAHMLGEPCIPGEYLTNRAVLAEAIRANVGTTYHPSSTCKMGPARDAMAVVDSQCRVRGTRGLRVVDASIFPTGPRANLHFSVAAVAEKVAEGMSNNSPLPGKGEGLGVRARPR